MLVYEIALDGELALDLVDLRVPIRRRDSRGTTILVVPRTPADSLSRILVLLGSLGIGVTAVHQREETGPGGGRCSSRCSPGLPRRSGRRSRTVILEEGCTAGRAAAIVELSARSPRRLDMSVNVDVGPIDYLALEFPGARLTGEGMAILVDLVDRGIIRILDMRALVRAEDGVVTAMAVSDLDGDGTLDLAVFEGVESDLIGDDDLQEAASLVEPGNAVALLVYENTWAGPFVSAMRRAGAEVVASVRLPADRVIARLEELDASESSAGAE